MMDAELGISTDFVEIVVDSDAMYLEFKIHVIIIDMGMLCFDWLLQVTAGYIYPS